MRRGTSVLIGIAFSALAGCGQGGAVAPDEEVALQQASVQEEALTVKVVAPSAEMLKAARAGAELPLLAAGTCNTASTCPTQYASCTNWSDYSVCDEGTCGDILCRVPMDCPDDPDLPLPLPVTEAQVRKPPCGWDYEDGSLRSLESYRVCFDPAQNACTEFRTSTQRVCGCL